MKKETTFCKTTYKNLIKYEGILIILLVILFPTTYTIWLILPIVLQVIIIISWWYGIKFNLVRKIKNRYPGAIKNIYITENFYFAVFKFELKDKDGDLKVLRKKVEEGLFCFKYSFYPILLFTFAWIIKFIIEMT